MKCRPNKEISAYYAQFFSTSADANSNDPQIIFDLSQMRPVFKSFMDSTIVELCLPNSEFTVHALIACLQMVQTETPKETKRCPQAMWDAIAALSVSPSECVSRAASDLFSRMLSSYLISLRHHCLRSVTNLGKTNCQRRQRRSCNGRMRRRFL